MVPFLPFKARQRCSSENFLLNLKLVIKAENSRSLYLCFRCYMYVQNTVYRMPGFLSNRPNLVPPPPQSLGSVAPPLFGSKGGDTLACGEGVGGPNSDEGTGTLVLYAYYKPLQCYESPPSRIICSHASGSCNDGRQYRDRMSVRKKGGGDLKRCVGETVGESSPLPLPPPSSCLRLQADR